MAKQQVECPNCGELFWLKQPDDHSEYTPAGKCDNCGKGYFLFRYMTDGNAILTETDAIGEQSL